jgi:hypothetical protein
VQRREMPLVELVCWLTLPAAYVAVVVALARWIALRLGVSLAAVAFPLALVPVVALFGRHWRHAWTVVTPVAAAVAWVLLSGESVTWQRTAALTGATMCLWLPVMFLIAAVLKRARPDE